MLTVRYALTREELRAWYKVTWLRKLWMFHLAIVVLLCGSFALLVLEIVVCEAKVDHGLLQRVGHRYLSLCGSFSMKINRLLVCFQ